MIFVLTLMQTSLWATLEGYAYADVWPEDAVIVSVDNVVPIYPG